MKEKKYFLSYDDFEEGKEQEDLLNSILEDEELAGLNRIIIGCWDFESGDNQELVDGIIANKEKFAHIESLFWGDIESEETEISWIEQTDLSEMLQCFPKLTDLTIKGTNSLSLGGLILPNLKSLEIITGGFPTEVVMDMQKSNYPNLERLKLYVGVENYGFCGDLSVFLPILSKAKFPKLKYLGIVNAEYQDQVLEMILDADILPQLETLDISCGVFRDNGGETLLKNADKLKHLKLIDITYNYLSDDMVAKLQKEMPCKVDTTNNKKPDMYKDEDYSMPMITE